MKFTTSAIIATTAAVVSALPADNPDSYRPGPDDVFSIMALRSASPVHHTQIQAINGAYYLGNPDQGAQCGPVNPNYAQFFLTKEGDLYLYTPNPPEQTFIDRSGMGQGVMGYTQGVMPIGRNQERGPFIINDEGNVVLNATGGAVGFQACPNALGGGYSVWLEGATNPGGNSDCIPFTAKAVKENNILKCDYSYNL
jgi:hypothetical protein